MIDTLARLIPAALDFIIDAGPLFWIVLLGILFSPCYLRTAERK